MEAALSSAARALARRFEPLTARGAGFERSLQFLRRHWPEILFVLLACGVFCWVSWEAIWIRSVTFEGGADYWEHSATLHALIESPLHPHNPHLVSPAPSPRFGPQFILIAVAARAFKLDVLSAMSLTAVLNTALFLISIWLFFATYFRHALAPLYGLLVMLFGWWRGFHWSNVYQLNVLFTVGSCPSMTAVGLTLLGFVLGVRILRAEVERPALSLFGLLVWASTVFIVHQLTAVLSLSGVILLALAEPSAKFRSRAAVVAVVVLGAALAQFWPYFSPWAVVAGGHGDTAGWASHSIEQAAAPHVRPALHRFYHLGELTSALGLSLLTLVAIPYFLLRRERLFVGLGALSMLTPFVANLFIDLPLGHRFILLANIYLQIGLVWLLLRITPGYTQAFCWVERPWLGRLAIASAALVLGVFFAHGVSLAHEQLASSRFQPHKESPVVRNMRAFAEAVGPSAVVLATPLISWPLPTFGPKVLSLFHSQPLVPDEPEREYYVARFLRGHISDEQYRAILDHYGVTHVLLSRNPSSSLDRFLLSNGRMRFVGTGFRLYTLDTTPGKAVTGK